MSADEAIESALPAKVAEPELKVLAPELPLQLNLFTRKAEPLRLEIVEPLVEREGEEVEVLARFKSRVGFDEEVGDEAALV